MQFTLTVAGLTASTAEALENTLECFPVAPLATSRNEIDESRGLWDLVAYFASEEDARAASRLIPATERSAIVPLPDVDWVRLSLRGLPPVAAGRFFLYGSHDQGRRRAGGVSLAIDAGTAFGTGHHATTQGCLLALDALIKRARPRCILDVGCGTGVLALAAAKARRVPVLASDIDPEAVHVARVNAHRNAASPLLRTAIAPGLAHPMVRAGAPYDLILANILTRPLISLAKPISRILATRGTAILSGFTKDQSHAVFAAYRSRGFILDKRIEIGSWSTLVVTKSE